MPLQRYTLTCNSGDNNREVWFLPGLDDVAHRLCLFLDAEFYLQRMESAANLGELMEAGRLPRCSLLFVSNRNAEARHFDYTWNERYAQFIAEDVVGWARSQVPTISASDNLIAGLSLSGLEAALIALEYPQTFSRALCQSGSFWWLHGKPIAFPATRSRFWLSVGSEETETGVTHPPTGLRQEISQIAGVDLAVQQLRAAGATIQLNQYAGGHSTVPWKEELPAAVEWLFDESSRSVTEAV